MKHSRSPVNHLLRLIEHILESTMHAARRDCRFKLQFLSTKSTITIFSMTF